MTPVDRRYKRPVEKRKFGQALFSFLEWRPNRHEAEGVARRWRGKGHSARLTRWNRGYSIYTRRG